jgi:hypothetical protein
MLSFPDIDQESPGYEPWKDGDPQDKRAKKVAKAAGQLPGPAAEAAAAAAAAEEIAATEGGGCKKVHAHALFF